jgi:hypothetical protein
MESSFAVAVPRTGLRERPRVVVLTVCGLAVLGAVVRFYGLAHQGLWFDEANTAQLVGFSPGDMLGLIPQTESTPPLYYMVAWVWVRVFSNDAAGLRSLSTAAGVLVIPVAYAAAAELVSRRAGGICAALSACNPFLIWYSQEARSYQLLVLLTGLALWAFARARRDPSPVNVGLWVLAAGLSMATHYFATLAIVPQAIALLAIHLPGLKALTGGTRVTELDVISMRSPGQQDCWWGAACNLISSAMQRSYPIKGLRTAWVRHVGQFTVRRLVAQRSVRLTPAVLSRALTATSLSHDELMVQPPRR